MGCVLRVSIRAVIVLEYRVGSVMNLYSFDGIQRMFEEGSSHGESGQSSQNGLDPMKIGSSSEVFLRVERCMI